MKRIPIQIDEYAGQILGQLPKGILLSTAASGEIDTMTIGWGMLGTDWSLPVFTALIRESRYTKVLLDESMEFTVNIPAAHSDVRRILGFCGTVSGRNHNKFKEMGLTVVPGVEVNAPAILELPITLECKVLYVQDQDPKAIPASILRKYYPTGDFHTAYTAQIVAAYILAEDDPD